MAWNEPGKPGQDPWGQSGNDPEPKKENQSNGSGGPNGSNRGSGDELEEMLKKVQDFFNGNNNGSGIGKRGLSAIFLVVLVVWGLTGIYIVDSPERGVVTRFGAFVDETTSGPHWHLPYPIESVTIVNVDQIRTAEIGYRSDSRNRSGTVASESLMLTKDENIIDVRIAVQYKIDSASNYLFDVSDPDNTLRTMTESALREVVGRNTMDFVLTDGRTEVVDRVKDIAQKKLNDYKTGLTITSVNLQDAQPPEQVQSAFADVVKAREDRERLINEAQAYSNDIIPKARGLAARQLEEASAYYDEVIAIATGKASRFTSIVTEYQKAPKVTRERLYIEAITNVFGNTSKVLVGSESGNNILYLPLDKMVSGQSSAPYRSAAQEQPVTVNVVSEQPASQPVQKGNIRDFLRNRELR